MKIYSIVRIGDEYVVRAGEKSVLKIASRRRAAQLVTDAVELLDLQAAPQLSPQDPPQDAPQDPCEPSTACDPEIIPDPSEVP
jgi:hypothetical protein